MAITTTTVTGPVLDTTGAAYTNVTVQFTPRAPLGDATENAVLADYTVSVTPNASTGAFSVDLAPSEGIPYDVAILHALPDRVDKYLLGGILVPDTTSVSLQELLADFWEPVEPIPTVAALTAALAAAEADADRAEAAATSAETDAATATAKAAEAAASATVAGASAATAQSAALAAGAPIFATTAAGLSGTSSGEYFYIIGASGGLAVYLNDGGSAVLTGHVAPNSQNLVEVFGLTGTGDETAKLQALLDYASANDLRVEWPDGGRYEFSKLARTGNVDWYCPGNVTFHSNKLLPDGGVNGDFQDDVAFDISGTEIGTVAVAQDFDLFATSVVLADASAVQVGDLIHLESTRLIPTDNYGRGSWHEGCVFEVLHKDGNTVHAAQPIPYFAKASDAVTGEVTAISGDRRTLTVDTLRPGTIRDQACQLTITDGAAAGEARYIVEVDGSDVTISDQRDEWPAGVQVGDAYRWAWETEAHIIRPVTVAMEGVTITRDQINTFTAEDQGFRGLRIFGGKGLKFERCRFENFSTTCVRLQKCVGPVFRDCAFDGANRAYNLSGGTGYGLSFETVSRGVVDNCTSYNCRRGFDATGSDGYSDSNTINMQVTGGGKTYTGADFFPVGDERQGGAGSHGSGLYTVYRDMRTINCYNVFNIRGREERVTNLTATGAMNRVYKIDKTCGFSANSGFITDLISETRNGTDDRWVPDMVDYGKRLEMLVDLDIQDNYSSQATTVIANQHVKSVSKCCIEATGADQVIRNFVAKNWYVEASGEGTAFDTFTFMKNNSTTTLGSGCQFFGITVRKQPDSGYTNFNPAIAVPEDQKIEPGEYIEQEGWFIGRVLASGILEIPCEQRMAMITLFNVRPGDRPMAANLLIESDSATTRGGTSNNIDVLATKPTDMTGITADYFGLNLDNATGILSVCNNTALDQTFSLYIGGQ